MRVKNFITLLLIPLALAFFLIFSVSCLPQFDEPTDVALIQLLANPKKYHGKTVRVIGFLKLGFESNILFFLEEVYLHRLYGYDIWIELNQEILKKQKELDSKYVLLEGKFDTNSHGHRGLSVGTLYNITRAEKWRSRDEL